MIRRIYTVVTLELMLARRNLWVILAIFMFGAFALILALLGAAQGGQWDVDVLSITSASLATLSVYLIPLIALLMSYESIAGEIERGALALVFATPLRRFEYFLSKFIAQSLVCGFAILVAFGLIGIVLAFVYEVGAGGVWAWIRLMLSSSLLGAVFVAIGLVISAMARRVAQAAAFVIVIWLLLVVLYDLALLGGVMMAPESVFSKVIFPWLMLLNPADAYRLYNLALLTDAPVSGLDGLARTIPFSPYLALLFLFLWCVSLLLLGAKRVQRIIP